MRALLSVYDKEGLVELAQGLSDLGWELVASGNTSAKLSEAGIAHQHTENPGNHGGRAYERYQVALEWLSRVLDAD